jgi:myo-inositol-1(or 4)-monophosphatase
MAWRLWSERVKVSSMDLRQLAQAAQKVCAQAGEHALRNQLIPRTNLVHSHQARQPGRHRYASDIDDKLQSFLLEGLNRLEPHKSFWDEMSGDVQPGDRFWCAGNIDGAINYARNLSEWAITVSLFEANERRQIYPILGIVYAPALGLTYLAARGQGAIRIRHTAEVDKRERIIPTTWPHLYDSVISFGMSYFSSESQRALATVGDLAGRPADIKRIGPVSLDLCKVADGTYDAYFEPSLHSWDIPAVSAGAIVVWEAQGHLSRWDGSLIDWHQANDVVATNAVIDTELMPVLARHSRPAAQAQQQTSATDEFERTQEMPPIVPD